MRSALILLLALASAGRALAQVTVPPELRELERITRPDTTATWKLPNGRVNYEADGFWARVYFRSTSDSAAAIIAQVGPDAIDRWVWASPVGWIRLTYRALNDYNDIQNAEPTDWVYPGKHPLELAFMVIYLAGDGVPYGAVIPRGVR